MGFLSNTGLFLFLLRVTLGIILLAHGIPKIMSIAGFVGHMAHIVGSPLNWVLGPIVIAIEVLGGVALLVGFKTRIAGLLVAALFFIIAFVVHFANLSDMFNLNMQDGQTLFEYPFLIAMSALAVASLGGGKYSKD